jgi:hypothetical protein
MRRVPHTMASEVSRLAMEKCPPYMICHQPPMIATGLAIISRLDLAMRC